MGQLRDCTVGPTLEMRQCKHADLGTLKAPPESRLALALEGDRVLHLVLPKRGAVTDSPSLGLLTPWEDLLQQ